MELRHYLSIVNRRKWVVIVTMAVTMLVVVISTFLIAPVYSTSAVVRIAQIQDRSVDYFDLNYSVRLINTYVELVRSRPFLEETLQRLALDVDVTDLSDMVESESVPNTELLKITARSSDPVTAMHIANTLGELLVEEGERLYSGQGRSAKEILFEQLVAMESDLREDRERLQSLLETETTEDPSAEAQDLEALINLQEQVYGTILDSYENARLSDATRAGSVTVVEPAVQPEDPSSPNVALNLIIGAFVGLVGGVGLAFLIENLDTSIYFSDDIAKGTQAPLIGSIPNLKVPKKLKESPLLLQPNGKSPASEAFRILRSNILTMDFGRPPRSMLVTSIEDKAGKSTVLANLAVALGQAGRDVVAVDIDLRGPSLAEVFKVSNEIGVTNVIVQGENAESAIQNTKIPGVSGVRVLPSGGLSQNPGELLGLPSLRTLIGDLANWVDLVLLDSPPIAQYSDAIVLAPLVDTVVLVVSRGRVSSSQVDKAVAQLTMVGVEQIGIVFNRSVTSSASQQGL